MSDRPQENGLKEKDTVILPYIWTVAAAKGQRYLMVPDAIVSPLIFAVVHQGTLESCKSFMDITPETMVYWAHFPAGTFQHWLNNDVGHTI